MGSNEPEWGIWNKATGDWVRNKVGQIDSRIFQCNIKSLLDNVVAKALVDNAVIGKQ